MRRLCSEPWSLDSVEEQALTSLWRFFFSSNCLLDFFLLIKEMLLLKFHIVFMFLATGAT